MDINIQIINVDVTDLKATLGGCIHVVQLQLPDRSGDHRGDFPR